MSLDKLVVTFIGILIIVFIIWFFFGGSKENHENHVH
ncbi:MAG: hypothetical protein US53_C0018G0006 [Candidatus Woesebacteria bacterium GW2011_GWA1_37_7]|uniref:Uncharacterized protein n=1 Tax=Candidatus Woesebacteria bacterium GW2011_GWA1_37_7 TaxID=1618545 RepID=A0A0G0H2H0_9BACT|nr:MAG: hypothetical protein US53_C0018G0006 [Candidatus Woesebacteria bacterium GW2011_GWA1_37_7]